MKKRGEARRKKMRFKKVPRLWIKTDFDNDVVYIMIDLYEEVTSIAYFKYCHYLEWESTLDLAEDLLNQIRRGNINIKKLEKRYGLNKFGTIKDECYE